MKAISAEITEITKTSTKLEIEIAAKWIVIEQVVKNKESIISFIIDYKRYLYATGLGICP